jgi:hypothetical protein
VWKGGADLAERDTFAQVHGKPRMSATELGWQQSLKTYRPFLSYSELGSMLAEGPSRLYKAPFTGSKRTSHHVAANGLRGQACRTLRNLSRNRLYSGRFDSVRPSEPVSAGTRLHMSFARLPDRVRTSTGRRVRILAGSQSNEPWSPRARIECAKAVENA